MEKENGIVRFLKWLFGNGLGFLANVLQIIGMSIFDLVKKASASSPWWLTPCVFWPSYIWAAWAFLSIWALGLVVHLALKNYSWYYRTAVPFIVLLTGSMAVFAVMVAALIFNTRSGWGIAFIIFPAICTAIGLPAMVYPGWKNLKRAVLWFLTKLEGGVGKRPYADQKGGDNE